MWTKSSFCKADQPMCVEVAEIDDHVVLRDAGDWRVRYSREEFSAFVAGVKAGDFDGFC